MFRDPIKNLSLRKKLTILATVGVFLPVLVLTYMQYQSLSELENKTKGAFKDNLRQGLTIVERQMQQRLAQLGSQTLDPIGSISLSSTGAVEKVERYFAEVTRTQKGIEEVFVFGYSGDPKNSSIDAYIYSDKFEKGATRELTPPQSAILSQFDSARANQSFLDDNRKYLFAHYSCPTCPSTRYGAYLFYPLKDPTRGELSGFAGVLLNEGFVKDDLIAGSITKALNRYHSHSESPAIAITISDENQRVLYSNATVQNANALESNLARPFSNWRAGIALKNTNLDELARASFLHSAGATLLVLVFLLCGIALAVRATDREARLAQSKSDFVSNVSHELKTPLSTISLFSEILELDRVNNEDKKKEYYRIIRHESRRLNKTIDNILDFSRIEAGRKKYELVEGNVAGVIDDVLSTHRFQIINSGFDIQTDIQPHLPPVLIDREAMAQAISNLLDNAIKYSGQVKRVSITAKVLGSNVSLEIADHGVGIPSAEQARVFEKFYRVGNGLVHDVKGSGLGLSLVKHIIEAHNGSISVESDVGKGSRFTILLPLATRGADAQAQSEEITS